MDGRSWGVPSTSLPQEHSRKRSPLVSPLRLGHHGQDGATRATPPTDPSLEGGGGGGGAATGRHNRGVLTGRPRLEGARRRYVQEDTGKGWSSGKHLHEEIGMGVRKYGIDRTIQEEGRNRGGHRDDT